MKDGIDSRALNRLKWFAFIPKRYRTKETLTAIYLIALVTVPKSFLLKGFWAGKATLRNSLNDLLPITFQPS